MAAGEGPSDETLARRGKAGDRDAMEALIRRYVRPVYAVATSFLSDPDDVEDAAQETFLRVVRALDRYDPTRPFAPWLYQIARNVARSQITVRGRRKDESLDAHDPVARGSEPDEVAERDEIRRRIDEEVARLPEQRRTAFRLVDVEGMGADEAGRLMGLAAGTVRAHVHHARRQLREALAEFAGTTQATGG